MYHMRRFDVSRLNPSSLQSYRLISIDTEITSLTYKCSSYYKILNELMAVPFSPSIRNY